MNKENRNPYISIIIPTYNVERYIDRCIFSCANQSYNDIEILVVDDCGTDRSIQIARDWSEKDSRVRIIRNPHNLGTYHARRRGVETAKGKYILFLDPDDTIATNSAEAIFKNTSLSQIDILFYGTEKITEKHKRITSKKVHSIRIEEDLHSEFLADSPTQLGTAGKVYKREILSKAFSALKVPENERLIYGEDAIILFGALITSKNGSTINDFLYKYHINQNSITNQNKNQDTQPKREQLEKAIRHIRNLASEELTKGNPVAKQLSTHFIKIMKCDSLMLERHTKDASGKKNYARCILALYRERRSFKDLFRIFIYFISAGTISL